MSRRVLASNRISCLCLLVGLVFGLTTAATLITVQASTVFHGYSYASDSGRWIQGSRWYSGVSVVHYDPVLAFPSSPTCGTLGTHPNLYETMWDLIDPTGGSYGWDWVEGGTYHQVCRLDGSEYKAWYSELWTFNFTTGQLNPPLMMSQTQITTTGQRRFFLVQGNSNGFGCGTSAWNFFVANGGAPVEYGCATFPNLGFKDEFGTELWDDYCAPPVISHSYAAGLDAINWGAWQSWLPDGGSQDGRRTTRTVTRITY